MTTGRAVLLVALFGCALGLSAPARAVPVDLELVLAVDCSRSIDSEEFALQVQGYAAAFRHPTIIGAIQSGRYRAIAVTYVQWAGPFLQRQSIGWTLIDGREAAEEFAQRMSVEQRAIAGGGTSLSGVIDFARPLFDDNGFESARRVIDISGDGINNAGRLPQLARDQAVSAGLTINGLAIVNEIGGLDRYFEEFVIGGPGAFVIAASDFDAFAAAILSKLIREIAAAPLP